MTRILAAASVGVLFSCLSYSQGATGGPQFEVASVKVNTTGERPTGDLKGDRMTMYNMPMLVLIARAYQVANDRVAGPEWLESQGYDIVAKFPPGSKEESLWLMVQKLLVDRFKLTVHRDQSVQPVYALVVGKSGPKFHESAGDSPRRPECSHEGQILTCLGQRSTMTQLAQNLVRWLPRNWLDLPVVDMTGLTSAYDFSLTWTMSRGPDDAVEPSAVSLFDAIQSQLGLKLERRKVTVERLVIDHIERVPTAN